MQLVISTLKHTKQTKNYPHSKYVDLLPPSFLRAMKSIFQVENVKHAHIYPNRRSKLILI